MILGVTGTNGAGKDTLADYLKTKGFRHISLSDIVREELIAKGIPLTRKNLQDCGNQMRRNFGSGVLAQKALSRMICGKNYVISSICNPGEIRILANAGNSIIVGVDAPINLRFGRAADKLERDEKNTATFADFAKSEDRELESAAAADQQLAECMKMADFSIVNDADFASFFAKIDGVLASIFNRGI